MTGVLLYCFNTESYRYDKIAAKTVPLLKKNLKLPITIVTNMETFKCMPPLGSVNYKIIDNETGNKINQKSWHNLDRHRAYELSPYEKTISVIRIICSRWRILTKILWYMTKFMT